MDAIVPICIAVNPQGTEWSGAAYEPTLYQGGDGGTYQKIACTPGYAVRHFHIYVGPRVEATVVKHVRMTCQRLGGNDYQNVVADSTGVSSIRDDKRFSCGDAEWGTGIYGKTVATGGLYLVERLGFVCTRTPPRAAAPSANYSSPSTDTQPQSSYPDGKIQ